MPIIDVSSYDPPKYLKIAHVQTIIPSIIRRHYLSVKYHRERISTPDEDFLDVDWSTVGSENLVVIVHGIDGNSEKHYVKGMVSIFNENDVDVCALNSRGCSGERNRKPGLYHGGATEDIQCLVQYLQKHKQYRSISFVGFSLGGNLILKYLGEQGPSYPPIIKAAATFSVPVDLAQSARLFDTLAGRFYFAAMMRGIFQKLEAKRDQLESIIDFEKLKKAKNFKEFDDASTAPIYGFDSAEDYWAKASSLPFLHAIHVPTLLVQAQDDPILSESCYPNHIAAQSKYLYLERPEYGGHVGFMGHSEDGHYWSEIRALEFLQPYIQSAEC